MRRQEGRSNICQTITSNYNLYHGIVYSQGRIKALKVHALSQPSAAQYALDIAIKVLVLIFCLHFLYFHPEWWPQDHLVNKLNYFVTTMHNHRFFFTTLINFSTWTHAWTSIGGRTGGEGGHWGVMPPQSFMLGGQCSHNIIQRQAHYSGIHGRSISEEATYEA